MKKLQNNFTTPEQSKRLLELGVPADSADCYLLRTRTKGDTFIVEVLHDELYSRHDKFTNLLEYLPCWSVGRLIEIMLLCHISDGAGIMFDKPLYEVSNCTNIEWCIRVLESSITYCHIDFSKLEG